MAQYDTGQLKALLEEIIPPSISPEAFRWLAEQVQSDAPLASTFSAIPRKTGKKIVTLSTLQKRAMESACPGFTIDGWSVDRAARLWLVMNSSSSDKEQYIRKIEGLFSSADVNESVALYSSLPIFEYPESWVARCAAGIRSNVGDVQDAIMCNNPYPSAYLDQNAWNQLVLKAFFTSKPVETIIGLDARANEPLARTLSDYAHERWSAHRSVDPQIWRLVGKFLDAALFPDIEKVYASEAPLEKEAALLACNDSQYPPAQELLNKNETARSAIRSGELTWDRLAEKKSNYVLQQ